MTKLIREHFEEALAERDRQIAALTVDWQSAKHAYDLVERQRAGLAVRVAKLESRPAGVWVSAARLAEVEAERDAVLENYGHALNRIIELESQLEREAAP